MDKKTKKNINLPPSCVKRRYETNKDIKILNRLAVNKILTNKEDFSVDSYTWSSKHYTLIKYYIIL